MRELFFADRVLSILLLPAGNTSLRAFGIMDGFTIKSDMAVVCGIVMAFPVWAWEICRFTRPAISPRERRSVILAVAVAFLLFAGGIAFGYALLGQMIKVLVGLFPPQVEFFPAASQFVSFVGFFLLACGLAFQLPCVLVLLEQLRVLRADTLRKSRRVSWFILFVFAEIITPVSDPIVATPDAKPSSDGFTTEQIAS
jgi:sec-independent protein translocase protein TatC